VEVGRWRTHLEAGLRQPAHRLDRLDGRLALAAERRLRRIRRGQHPRQRGRGQRHLQVDRRRQDLEARLGAGGPDRDADRAPGESRHRVCRRARPRVRPQPGARRLPDEGRRAHVAAGAQEGRRHGRVGRRLRPVQPDDRVRRALAGEASAMGAGERRSGQRPPRVPGRRRHVEAVDGERAARRRVGQGGRGGGTLQRRARLRAHRGAGRRAGTARCVSAPGTTRRSPSTR